MCPEKGTNEIPVGGSLLPGRPAPLAPYPQRLRNGRVEKGESLFAQPLPEKERGSGVRSRREPREFTSQLGQVSEVFGTAQRPACSHRSVSLGFALGPKLGEQPCSSASSVSPAHGWDLDSHSVGFGILIWGRRWVILVMKYVSPGNLCLLPV